jgi:cold-inducible RNA-binding protein
MSAKLFVGNLSPETTTDELRSLFSEVGVVDSCQLIMGPDTSRSKGFGFIEMSSVESADAAKEKFNGQVLNGRTIKVDDAKPKSDYRNPAGYRGPRRP